MIKPGKKIKRIITAVIAVILLVSISFFTTDLIRAKKYSLPPMFCIPVFYFPESGSVDYYGLGYKVWEDTDPFDDVTHYYVGFWLLPKMFNI